MGNAGTPLHLRQVRADTASCVKLYLLLGVPGGEMHKNFLLWLHG